MYKAKIFFVVLITLCCFFRINAQGIGIDQWRDHLPYKNCISVSQVDNRIYCATKYSLFYYDKSDNSIGRLNKINGLSDVDITTINYDVQSKYLFIAYKDANIDLLNTENNTIINIPDIKIKPIIGEKKINKILFINKKAYLSCGFGIVVLDLLKKEVKDTYIIGENGTTIEVFDLAKNDTFFVAATSNGIYKARMDEPNLSNYASWHKQININYPDAKYNAVIYFENKLYVNKSSSQYNQDTMYVFNGSNWQLFDTIHLKSITKYCFKIYNDILFVATEWGVSLYNKDGDLISVLTHSEQSKDIILDNNEAIYWLANSEKGLIKIKQNDYEYIVPNGPSTTNVVAMSVENGNLWVAPGGYELSTWSNIYNTDGLFSFIDEKWSTIDRSNTPALNGIYDFITIAVDPFDSKSVFAGAWGTGLLEFYNGDLKNIYNETNSPIGWWSTFDWIGIGGLCYDDQHNLWISNMKQNSGDVLIVKKNNGDWKKFDLGYLLNGKNATRLMIDHNNQKWIMLSRGGGIAVFNDNNTIDNTSDDKVKVLGTEVGQGKLTNINVTCFATDLDGKVWVGTSNGLSVFYSPENIFSGQNFDSQEILVEQDGHTRPLLEDEYITSIAVDGGNRKWIGTQNSGVYLMSADGTKEIYQFNTSNSPLISNTINSIAIDGKSGEVFFGTDKGIISFKGTSTLGDDTYDNIFAYPNPVREDYEGLIAIKGLVTNSIVKITDISGNLIFETVAEGGEAVWSGKNFSGEKAKTGVYLVFCTNEDGSKTEVTKILVIN